MGCSSSANTMMVITSPAKAEGYQKYQYEMKYFQNGYRCSSEDGQMNLSINSKAIDSYSNTPFVDEDGDPLGNYTITWRATFTSTNSMKYSLKKMIRKYDECTDRDLNTDYKVVYIHVNESKPSQSPILINLNNEVGFLLDRP
eukprot:320352_1